MMHHDEIARLNNLAHLAKTLLDTGHPEARDAAQPIIALIKSQFQPVSAQADTDGDQQEWRGKGLPPVGAIVEFFTSEAGWCWSKELKNGMQVEIIGHFSPCQDGDLVAVFAFGDNSRGRSTAQAVACCFRPLSQGDSCNQAEDAGSNLHYDPVAAATERLRWARAEVKRREADAHSSDKTGEQAHAAFMEAVRAENEALSGLHKAIDAANAQ